MTIKAETGTCKMKYISNGETKTDEFEIDYSDNARPTIVFGGERLSVDPDTNVCYKNNKKYSIILKKEVKKRSYK